jgi:hypothetical protein
VKANAQNPWREISAARFQAVHLEALSPLRDRANVRIHIQRETAWVRWSGDNNDVMPHLLPIPGVEFFALRSGSWFRFRSLLPAVEKPPDDDGLPLSSVLFPRSFTSVQPETNDWPPVGLSIVRSAEPKPASALVCTINDIQKWADSATTSEIAKVKGTRANGKAILLGSQLPSIANATRYWGDTVFVPLGFRPEPDLPPKALQTVVGANIDELVFLNKEGAMIVPRKVFEILTRAGIRLARNPV